jgi:hypothetical protein
MIHRDFCFINVFYVKKLLCTNRIYLFPVIGAGGRCRGGALYGAVDEPVCWAAGHSSEARRPLCATERYQEAVTPEAAYMDWIRNSGITGSLWAWPHIFRKARLRSPGWPLCLPAAHLYIWNLPISTYFISTERSDSTLQTSVAAICMCEISCYLFFYHQQIRKSAASPARSERRDRSAASRRPPHLGARRAPRPLQARAARRAR